MINIKNLLIIVFFVATSLAISVFGLVTKKSVSVLDQATNIREDEEIEFKDVFYFYTQKKVAKLRLKASKLNIINEDLMLFTDPIGFDVESEMDFQSDKGKYTTSLKQLKLVGNVRFHDYRGTFWSDEFFYDAKKAFAESKGNVRSVIKGLKTQDILNVSAQYLTAWIDEGRSHFLGNVKATVERKRKYEGNVHLAAQKMDFYRNESRLNLDQDVALDYSNYDVSAKKGEVFLENYNKKLKYYVLYDDIKLVEQLELDDGSKSQRTAYAEKMEGFMRENKVVLSGAPKVIQGDDVIKGIQIILRENVEVVEVDDSQSSFDLTKE